ncbi:unnamed protein product [Paramecium primaurelia]|uniref:Uncharacterized protein n=1 Tax=Paramecium primaurelia TaxID=5886 RepID=A0A8S1PGP3_PARPR|nr:unnamed protein product [Paramecium primaurelia]
MKIEKSLKQKHDKIKKHFLQVLMINAEQKRQLKVIQIRNNYKFMKAQLFNWHLALMRKYRMNEICHFVKNKYKRKLQNKVVKLLIDYSQERQYKRKKLIKADNYYNNRILNKSFKALRINEKQSKQEFLEKRKMIDEKDQQLLNNQKELQKKLMADAFHSSKLMLKSFLNWKKYIFYQDKQDFYFSYKQNIDNCVIKQQELQSEQVKINKNTVSKSEYCIMLEYKIQFYQKHQDQLTNFQKEILKKEICQLKQLL